jgi:2-polyprenyl-3-methyl-5-hydroxy-6-metoxy-1,4-benzoquinol methylase
MDCCQRTIQGTDKFFSKTSRKYLKSFRKKGLAKEQKYLIEGITSVAVRDKTILEIGCGVGGLHLTLLKEGAHSAVGIDIAQGMLDGAKNLSKELGMEARTEYILGDFVQLNGKITDADITVLDKVVCCYENVDVLLDKSLAKTRNIYALSFPKSNTLIKFFFFIPITVGKLLKWQFRPYWHEWDAVVKRIESAGFKQTYNNATLFWDVRVFGSVSARYS